MPFETEIKITLKTATYADEVLSRCRTEFDIDTEEAYHKDEYFDTEHELLRKQDFTLRLRGIGEELFVALKGPRMFMDEKVHTRIELEFVVGDKERLYAQINMQGLRITTQIEKLRWTFNSGSSKICIDKLPFIGYFVEIEGSYEEIGRIMPLLGLSRDDAVPENYTELLETKLRSLGQPVRPNLVATFSAEKEVMTAFDLSG